MRRGEIVKIQKHYIEFNQNKLYVPEAKNAYSRYPSLNANATKVLKYRLSVCGKSQHNYRYSREPLKSLPTSL